MLKTQIWCYIWFELNLKKLIWSIFHSPVNVINSFCWYCNHIGGQGIWSNNLSFCILFIFSMDYDSSWYKLPQMVCQLFSNCWELPRPLCHNNISFSRKHKTFDTIARKIWFWLTLTKELRAKYYLTWMYMLSKIVKLGNKNRELISSINVRLSCSKKSYFVLKAFLFSRYLDIFWLKI